MRPLFHARTALVLAGFLASAAAVSAGAETIRVGVAISLKEAVSEIGKAYEAESGDKVELSFGSSGQIAAQIKGGAPIDLFISAANKQVDDLAKDKLVDAGSRKVVAFNTLVLVVPAGAKQAPADFDGLTDAGVKKIAAGEPKTVPAGQYAQQVFDALKLTQQIKPKLVYGANVRQVLLYVERGEVYAGVVYATDAKESGDKVKVVATADAKTHEPIVYPAVIVTASKKQDVAKRFLTHLTGEKAQAALKARGFASPGEESVGAPK
jgi:molybdate transport system substrate-binding protein